MSTKCNLSAGIKHFGNVDFDGRKAEVSAGLFFADGCLCLVFAIFTHFKYTSVSVLNHSFHTKAMSNVTWIWFFIFTAISSIMNGLNVWPHLYEKQKNPYPFIVGWITHLLGVLSLAYAIKYQWKYREEAYHDMSYDSERTPVLFHRAVSKKPSSADILFFVIFCISLGLFIAGIKTDNSDSYWISFSFAWLIRIAIFILVFVIHYKFSVEGPSIFIKCLLLAGVLFTTPCDIPSYIWLKCILDKSDAKARLYDTLIGLVLLSHVVFFFALRSEFLRLRDITRWHIADRLEDIEKENKRFRDS